MHKHSLFTTLNKTETFKSDSFKSQLDNLMNNKLLLNGLLPLHRIVLVVEAALQHQRLRRHLLQKLLNPTMVSPLLMGLVVQLMLHNIHNLLVQVIVHYYNNWLTQVMQMLKLHLIMLVTMLNSVMHHYRLRPHYQH